MTSRRRLDRNLLIDYPGHAHSRISDLIRRPWRKGNRTVLTEDSTAVTAASVTTAAPPQVMLRSCRVAALASSVTAQLRPGLDDPLQSELAELLDVLADLTNPQHQQLVPFAELAAAALLMERPNLTLATGIREKLKSRIRRSHHPLNFLRGGSPPTRVILGLGTLLYFALPALYLLGGRVSGREEVLGLDSSMLVLVGLAGALGSIVSIMVRVQDFGRSTEADPSVLFFTGFFKPVVGMAFALFVFAVLSAGILPITIDPTKARYFFAALGFVSGFSERFASDVASRTEGIVNAPSPLA